MISAENCWGSIAAAQKPGAIPERRGQRQNGGMAQRPHNLSRRIFWGVSLIPIGVLIAMLAPALEPERGALIDDFVWAGALLLSGIGPAMVVSAPFACKR